MQVDPDMIPAQAVEAAAEAVYEHWQFETPQGHRYWTPHGNSLSQDRARDFARAAITAALAAWPRSWFYGDGFMPPLDTNSIILPLAAGGER